MSEDPKGGFFQFPLCLLATAGAFTELLSLAFGYGACHMLDKSAGREWRKTKASREKALGDARSAVKFSGGDPERLLAAANDAEHRYSQWLSSGRKTAWVRLRTDIYFSIRDKKSLSERELRILCAVYSAIGDKAAVVVGWRRIQWRAAGWLSLPVDGQPCGPLYPRHQIDRTCAKLKRRGLLFSVTYNRGERYWSHRLNNQQIWDFVKARKMHSIQALKNKSMDYMQSAALVEERTRALQSVISMRKICQESSSPLLEQPLLKFPATVAIAREGR